jgi:hypothetical protein
VNFTTLSFAYVDFEWFLGEALSYGDLQRTTSVTKSKLIGRLGSAQFFNAPEPMTKPAPPVVIVCMPAEAAPPAAPPNRLFDNPLV